MVLHWRKVEIFKDLSLKLLSYFSSAFCFIIRYRIFDSDMCFFKSQLAILLFQTVNFLSFFWKTEPSKKKKKKCGNKPNHGPVWSGETPPGLAVIFVRMKWKFERLKVRTNQCMCERTLNHTYRYWLTHQAHSFIDKKKSPWPLLS